VEQQERIAVFEGRGGLPRHERAPPERSGESLGASFAFARENTGPRASFEQATIRLTVERSTAELPGSDPHCCRARRLDSEAHFKGNSPSRFRWRIAPPQV